MSTFSPDPANPGPGAGPAKEEGWDPDRGVTDDETLASTGPTGETGSTGPTGPTGATGETGA